MQLITEIYQVTKWSPVRHKNSNKKMIQLRDFVIRPSANLAGQILLARNLTINSILSIRHGGTLVKVWCYQIPDSSAGRFAITLCYRISYRYCCNILSYLSLVWTVWEQRCGGVYRGLRLFTASTSNLPRGIQQTCCFLKPDRNIFTGRGGNIKKRQTILIFDVWDDRVDQIR